MKKTGTRWFIRLAIMLLPALSTLNQEEARVDSGKDEPNYILNKQCTKTWFCILPLSSMQGPSSNRYHLTAWGRAWCGLV